MQLEPLTLQKCSEGFSQRMLKVCLILSFALTAARAEQAGVFRLKHIRCLKIEVGG